MSSQDLKGTLNIKDASANICHLSDLQCKIASDSVHLMDLETDLADTAARLISERAKNKRLVKIVHFLEGKIEQMKEHYNKRLKNITKAQQLEAQNFLRNQIEKHFKKVAVRHFQELMSLRQKYRHQLKLNNEVTFQFDD